MKIFSAEQMKQWDAFTIKNEPIDSIALMERAATACCNWLIGKNLGNSHFRIFCGKGNNGGDGLALARLLIQHQCLVTVYIPELGNLGSADFQNNLAALHTVTTDIHFLQSPAFFPEINQDDTIIDALFGTGLDKPLESIHAALVQHLNQSGAPIISIDMPSGLYADRSSAGNTVIKADHTLSFQNYKLAFLLPENEAFVGIVHILHIGLHSLFEATTAAAYELVEETGIRAIYKPRTKFAHKGTYGHAALVCGSIGMMGAAVLSSLACLRGGAGKLTVYIPACGYSIVQTAVPEAMTITAGSQVIETAGGTEQYSAVGLGPGIGKSDKVLRTLKEILEHTTRPMVIDADALNLLASNKALLKKIPPHSILTPHPTEFERIFGKSANDFERAELARSVSKELNIFIILKGHFTLICSPSGPAFFNTTGNPGMATAGSGDVLTGILTALLAQHYNPLDACLLGAYIHGMAGDIAAGNLSPEAMIAGDIINNLGTAFKQLSSTV